MESTLYDIFIQAAKSPYSVKETTSRPFIKKSTQAMIPHVEYGFDNLFTLKFKYYGFKMSIGLCENNMKLFGFGSEMQLTHSQKEDCLEAWMNKSHNLNDILEYLKK